MRVISKRTLQEFWERHADAQKPLQAWYDDALRADWQTPAQIKELYGNASFLADNRVVFNINGNDYRVIVKVHYDQGHLYIRFVGTHRAYDELVTEPVEVTIHYPPSTTLPSRFACDLGVRSK